MVNLSSFINKRVLYVGHDTTHESLKVFLSQYASISDFVVVTHEEYEAAFKEDDVIVKSPNVPGKSMNHVYTTPARIFFDCAYQEQATIIGVTGTKGKTTVSSLIHTILRQNNTPCILVNDVSDPMFTHAHELNEKSNVVIELSSMDAAELEVSPHITVVTSLGKAHIDYHGSIDAYWEAMHNTVRFMGESGKVIFNPDTDMVYHWLAATKAEQHPIDPQEQVDMSKSPLFGEHNRHNFLMARAVTQLLGVEKFVASSALNTFDALRHRLQVVRDVNGVVYVDNAIADDPETAVVDIEACVRYLKPVGCVMLGGGNDARNPDEYAPLVKIISTLRVPAVVLFPGVSSFIKDQFPETYSPEVLETESMDEAVVWASEKTPSGSACLLSTASASQPLWKDFKEKGDQFQSAVQKL